MGTLARWSSHLVYLHQRHRQPHSTEAPTSFSSGLTPNTRFMHEHASQFQGAMTLFFSIATLFLSIAVVVIAALQLRVADDKLRLDLFDRRYKVYDVTRKFLIQIAQYNSFDESELVDFAAGIS